MELIVRRSIERAPYFHESFTHLMPNHYSLTDFYHSQQPSQPPDDTTESDFVWVNVKVHDGSATGNVMEFSGRLLT